MGECSSSAAAFRPAARGRPIERRRRQWNVDVLGCKLVVAESLTEADGQFVFGPTKTHQVREVPLPRSLFADLERHLDTGADRQIDALLFRQPGAVSQPTPHLRPGSPSVGGGVTIVADHLDRARQMARTTPAEPMHARPWRARVTGR